jgi:hypothetical protein
LIVGLSFLPWTAEARALVPGFNEATAATRLESHGFLERFWEALTRLLAADGSRIDPNGVS